MSLVSSADTCPSMPFVRGRGHIEMNVVRDGLVGSHLEQARGLVDGGADILRIEAIFDTQNTSTAWALSGHLL